MNTAFCLPSVAPTLPSPTNSLVPLPPPPIRTQAPRTNHPAPLPCNSDVFESTDLGHCRSRRISDVLKRKKPPKRGSRKGSRGEDGAAELLAARGASGTSRSAPMTRTKHGSKEGKSGGGATKSSFLASLNPSRWGRSSSATLPDRPPPPRDPVVPKSPTPSISNQKEKVRQWIKEKGALDFKTSQTLFRFCSTLGSCIGHTLFSALSLQRANSRSSTSQSIMSVTLR